MRHLAFVWRYVGPRRRHVLPEIPVCAALETLVMEMEIVHPGELPVAGEWQALDGALMRCPAFRALGLELQVGRNSDAVVKRRVRMSMPRGKCDFGARPYVCLHSSRTVIAHMLTR